MRTGFKRSVILLTACLTVAVLTPVRANANVLDAFFGARSELSGVLIDKMGAAVLKVLHPSSKHSATKATRTGQSEVSFTTEYKGWLKAHVLTWRVTLDSEGRIEDILFQDSNPLKSGPIAKEVLMQLKTRVMQFIEDYRKDRLSSR